MRQRKDTSPDHFDFEEVMGEFGDIEAGGVDLEDSRRGKGSQLNNEDSVNSFDLDNSDDLNRFIQKYETILDGDGNKKSTSKLAAKRDSTGLAPAK